MSDSPVEWVFLSPEETIRDGDEFWNGSHWMRSVTTHLGKRVGSDFPVRRAAVLADLPEWGLVLEGVTQPGDEGICIPVGSSLKPQKWEPVAAIGMPASMYYAIRRRLALPAALVVEPALGCPEGLRDTVGESPPNVTDVPPVECPRCDGSGGDPDFRRLGGIPRDCAACGGSGELKAPTPPAEWKPKFKVGDKVKILPAGKSGRVEVVSHAVHKQYFVSRDDIYGASAWLDESNLTTLTVESPASQLPCPWCIPGVDNCHHSKEEIMGWHVDESFKEPRRAASHPPASQVPVEEKRASKWVTCPICGGTDMAWKEDGDEGEGIIECTNLACRSNKEDGWDEKNALLIKQRDAAQAKIQSLTAERDAANKRAKESQDLWETDKQLLANAHKAVLTIAAELDAANKRADEAEEAHDLARRAVTEQRNNIHELESDLASLRALYAWVPLEARRPTEADCDEDGFVMIRWRRNDYPTDIGMERAHLDTLDDNAGGEMTEIHWLGLSEALPKLPLPTAPVVEDAQREKFESAFEGRPMRRGNDGEYLDTDTQLCWIGWEAAFLAGQNSTKP